MVARLQVHVKTTYSQAAAMKQDWIKNVGQYATRRNSRFITLVFRRDIGIEEMQTSVERFREKLIEASGIHPSRLYLVVFYMTKPFSHVHAFAMSDKDRRTGKSISNMSRATLQGLSVWWEKEAGCSDDSKAVWDASRLFDYLSGTENIRRPGQEWAVEVFNKQFLERLARRQERRSSKHANPYHTLGSHPA
jgi:hypothetical protein